MESRTFYLPQSNISKYIMNRICDSVPCSISELKVIKLSDIGFIKFSINCRKTDLPKITKLLSFYGAI